MIQQQQEAAVLAIAIVLAVFMILPSIAVAIAEIVVRIARRKRRLPSPEQMAKKITRKLIRLQKDPAIRRWWERHHEQWPTFPKDGY